MRERDGVEMIYWVYLGLFWGVIFFCDFSGFSFFSLSCQALILSI
jgi:hypothetical protein